MSDLSHESREVLRLHTEALNNFTANFTDIAWKIEHGTLLHEPMYEFSDTVDKFKDAISDLKKVLND